MERNVGNLDRIIRLVLGVVLIIAGFYYHWILAVIGVIPLVTGLFNYCPLYKLLKISTYKK